MGNTWSKGRIESVHAETDIDRRIKFQFHRTLPVLHLVNFHTELLCLRPLVAVHGPNTDLNQTIGQMVLHYSGKRAGMRETVPLQFVVEIRMRIEMENGQTIIS